MARRTVNLEREREKLLGELAKARELVSQSWTRDVGTTLLQRLETGLREVHTRVTKRLRALRRLERKREQTDKKRAASAAIKQALAS